MTQLTILRDKNLDVLSYNLEDLLDIPDFNEYVNHYLDGDFYTVLRSSTSLKLFDLMINNIPSTGNKFENSEFGIEFSDEHAAIRVFIIGLSAFSAFLQANITGPAFDWAKVFSPDEKLRNKLLASLDIGAISVYQGVPHVELFCLARTIFTIFFPRIVGESLVDCKWMSLRINFFHQRLLVSLTGGNLHDGNLLHDVIDQKLNQLDKEILGLESKFSNEQKVQFCLERTQILIFLGQDSKARESIQIARQVSGFKYALSGALGKRTKYQEIDISQLVLFAKSKISKGINKAKNSDPTENFDSSPEVFPEALKLNDETLLESISFSKTTCENCASYLPPELANLNPEDQPHLNALDQIALLTEATLRDKLSPIDAIRCEEILPFANRVISDKPTNWQIYTQALLIRSRIEFHRSRTQERSILQLQIIVDQIIAETQECTIFKSNSDDTPVVKVTSFLPKPKTNESARAQERLKYIFSLNSPTVWELEIELAFSWSAIGSFSSALNIFKRLHLWAEVALCYHSISQEAKARQIIRRQLFFSAKGKIMDKYEIDAQEIADEKWEGELRPNPPNAPRLWCILGDLDNDPSCWERAWNISKHRYARAQRALGEYFVKAGKLTKAREAYFQASIVHRQNEDTWSRLGDIDLKLGNWDGAYFAFQKSIMLDDSNAKTYSNLGSALLSKYYQLKALQKEAKNTDRKTDTEDDLEKQQNHLMNDQTKDPSLLIKQALEAYKRAAKIAHSRWEIWDNVITISLLISPPSYQDLLIGIRNIVRIRAASLGENSIDAEALGILITEITGQARIPNSNPSETPEANGGIYIPPRGSLARATIQFVQEDIIPLLNTRVELFELIEKVALYQMNFSEALDYAVKAWRALLHDETWLLDAKKWERLVEITIKMADGFETYGPMQVQGTESTMIEPAWREKAKKAVKAVLGRARDTWEESKVWDILQIKLKHLTT